MEGEGRGIFQVVKALYVGQYTSLGQEMHKAGNGKRGRLTDEIGKSRRPAKGVKEWKGMYA